jgi:hypothetical protein
VSCVVNDFELVLISDLLNFYYIAWKAVDIGGQDRRGFFGNRRLDQIGTCGVVLISPLRPRALLGELDRECAAGHPDLRCRESLQYRQSPLDIAGR